MPTLNELFAYSDQLTALGVKPHPSVAKAKDIQAALHASYNVVAPDTLSLTPEEAVAWATTANARRDINYTTTVTTLVEPGLTTGLQRALTEDVDRVIEALRPLFDEHVEGVYTAVREGVIPGAKAEDVVFLGTEAIKAWAELPKHIDVLDRIGTARVSMSRLFGLAPEKDPVDVILSGRSTDYGPAFGAGGGYVVHPQVSGHAGDRWLTLAASTQCQLTLCSIADAEALLHGTGTPPGYVVAAPLVIVTDEDGRQVHLYRADGHWIPSWVDDEQLERLLAEGYVAPAPVDAIRPPDVYPADAAQPKARRARVHSGD